MFRILIPARGGSKRIKNKNLLKIQDKSLLHKSIEISLKFTDEVYVSTDSEKIKKEALKCGAKVHTRPLKYATDTSSTKEVVYDFLNTYNDTKELALIQCTSPFIQYNHLKQAINKIPKFSSVISVYKDTSFYWEELGNNAIPKYDIMNKPRTQDMVPLFKETGAFYIFNVLAFLHQKTITPTPTGLIKVDLKSSFDIDTLEEYELIKLLK